MTAYNTFVYLVGEDKKMFTVLERIKMTVTIHLFTLLERIKMTAYNTFVYLVGEDKDDCL